MLKIISTPSARFSCQRNCTPGHACRFSAVLSAIGAAIVTSHTVTVEVQVKDKGPLGAAVEAMGGTVLGDGTHKLYSNNCESGFGFTLPCWRYPLILRDDGTLAFDDYHGHWGNPEDLKKLTARYAIEAARQAADVQGWNAEDQHDGSLKIEHPSGAYMTVQPDGTVEAFGFIGSACDVTSVIEEAMGKPTDRAFKPEYEEHSGLRI